MQQGYSEIEVDTGILSSDYTDQFLQSDGQSGEGEQPDGDPIEPPPGNAATRRHHENTENE